MAVSCFSANKTTMGGTEEKKSEQTGFPVANRRETKGFNFQQITGSSMSKQSETKGKGTEHRKASVPQSMGYE